MPEYKFTQARIDEHLAQVGVDVRPVIEVRAERQKLTDFGLWMTDKWPALYENIVQGPSAFQMTKKFVFPGKGEVELPTFLLTSRGPVFVFPHKLSMFEEELDLPECRDVVLEALEQFRNRWGQCKHVRLGKVTTFVFDCSPESALDIVTKRFTRLKSPASEIQIRFNMPTDDFNRTINLDAVARADLEGKSPAVSAVRVAVDFNNIAMSEDMGKEKKMLVLHEADRFCENELYDFLNAGGEK